ncbi:hypothetical protein Vretimale_18133 [Volvox reticuliferus]|uniref:Uncharacterized protein n=1 Tax=Volvox reticuliferus TaxID=1737510 RepID=A0A8J4GWH5_9CHLO|nr:hypothetical protein Vretifemale_17771 [Volvox reticuliferus]GIM15238.1 hypothetical protein Vretimale_18133 [Volvox reticuliferus]
MEYCSKGTLFNMIKAARTVHTDRQTDFLPPHWARRLLEVLVGAARGLAYMHEHRIVHRDVKSNNLLLDFKNGQWITKVCDFNYSLEIARDPGPEEAPLSEPIPYDYWSQRWQSPETLLQKDVYGFPSDVFSFAVVIWEVVTLQRPWDKELELIWPDREFLAIINMYKDKRRLVFPGAVQPPSSLPPTASPSSPNLPSQVVTLQRPSNTDPQNEIKGLVFPKEVQAQLEDLCQRCWREDPQERPSMRQVADELMKLHEDFQRLQLQLQVQVQAQQVH